MVMYSSVVSSLSFSWKRFYKYFEMNASNNKITIKRKYSDNLNTFLTANPECLKNSQRRSADMSGLRLGPPVCLIISLPSENGSSSLFISISWNTNNISLLLKSKWECKSPIHRFISS